MFKFIKSNPKFTQLISINLCAKIGDRLFYTPLLTLAATLSKAKLAVMLVAISETLPILLNFFLGSRADQKRHKLVAVSYNAGFRGILYLIIASLLHFQPSLTLIISIVSFNLISDLLGNYSSALTTPFTKLLITPDEMQQAQGIVSLTTQLVHVAATFIGAVLLTFFSNQTIAYLNAALFLLTAILYRLMAQHLIAIEKQLPQQKNTHITQLIKINFSLLANNRSVLNELCQLALINGFFGATTPIFVLFLKEDQPTLFFSQPLTIALLSGLVTSSMLLGNGLSSKIWTYQSNQTLNNMAFWGICCVSLGFFLNNTILVLSAASSVAFLLGLVSPRFSAAIITYYPTANLGGIVTMVNSLLMLIPPATSFIFPIIATINLTVSYGSFLLYGLILLAMSWFTKFRD